MQTQSEGKALHALILRSEEAEVMPASPADPVADHPGLHSRIL